MTIDLRTVLDVKYTDDQMAAITAPNEPMLIVAGAGSGKTAVMAARVVWLVATGAVRADSVLGLTFTNKAASSLAHRVALALEKADLIDPSEPGPVVSTYHAFAGQILSDYGLRVGVEPHARVITDAARAMLALRVLRRTDLPIKHLTGTPIKNVGRLLALDDALAEQGLSPADLVPYDEAIIKEVDDLGSKTNDFVRDARDAAYARLDLGALVDEFRDEKLANDFVDFADQIRLALEVVRTQPDVVEALRQQFGVVLLDEYQDTSVAQRLLLATAFGDGHPVTAVGDPLQAIYGWRGASVDNIDSFPEHFARANGSKASYYSLAANMRSGQRILDAANNAASDLRALHPTVRPLTQGNAERGPGGVRLALLPTWADEVEWVADRVAEQLREQRKPEHIAVLGRRGADLADIDAALAARGIPTTVADLEGLLSIPEVVDVVSMLEVLLDPTANTSLVRLLAGPRWAIGARDLALLGRRARHLAKAQRSELPDDATLGNRVAQQLVTDPVDVVALIDAVDDPGDYPFSEQALERFIDFSAEVRQLRRHVGEPLADLVRRVTQVTGLELELQSRPSLVSRHRSAVLASFVELAANFTGLDGEATLAAFIAYLRAGEDFDSPPSLVVPPAPDAVVLLTVHRAKGLEWPVVVVPNLSERVFPTDRSRPRHTKSPSVLPHGMRADSQALPEDPVQTSADHKRFIADMKAHTRYEELRLGYVAATRAESLLLASGSWWGPSQKKKRGPSELLLALHDAALAGAGTVDQWTPEPTEDENPALAVQERYPFLEALDSAETVAQRRLAAAVNTALAHPSDALTGDLGDLDADIERVLARLRAERAPERHVVLPAALTASQVQRLVADPDDFVRRLARPMPQAPRPAATRGSELHAAIERHFGAAALIEIDELAGAADSEQTTTDITDLVAAFTASPWSTRTPVAVEWPFTVTLGGRVIRGRVDAVFAAASVPFDEVARQTTVNVDQTVVLVDWKTGRPGSGDPTQLGLYRLAWARAHDVDPESIRACFVHLPSGTVVVPAELPSEAELVALVAPTD